MKTNGLRITTFILSLSVVAALAANPITFILSKSKLFSADNPSNTAIYLFLNYGFPFFNDGIGHDFQVHRYMASQIGENSFLRERTLPPAIQRELYGHPPVVPFLFKWAVNLDPTIAACYWAIFLTISIFFMAKLWTDWALHYAQNKNFSPSSWVMATLFTVSYPSFFSIERGGVDVLAWFFLTLSIFFLLRRIWFLAGAAAVVSVFFKVYPILFVAGMSAAALSLLIFSFGRESSKQHRKAGIYIILGQLTAAAFVLALFWEAHLKYWRYLVDQGIRQEIIFARISHSFTTLFGPVGWGIGIVAFLLGLLKFCIVLQSWVKDTKSSPIDLLLVIAFNWVLMISLFQAAFDYNLILAIPFILILSVKAENRFEKIILVSYLLGYSLPRWSDQFLSFLPHRVFLYAGFQLFAVTALSGCWIYRLTRQKR